MEQKLGRGISLRKKRTVKQKISNPIITKENDIKGSTLPSIREDQQRPPLTSNPSNSSLTVPRARGAPQESTADYVKRRYSTRIPQLPKDFGDAAAPTLPSVPGEFLGTPPARSGTKSRSRERGEKVPVEMKALQDPNLPAEQYVARLLANASEQDIKVYQQDLGKIKNRTSTDLQHNAYQNRSQFIKISQEADKLKGEMRALRNLMSDLTSTLNQTNAALGINTSDTVSARKYANRSSVANLEAMWSTHLQELWRRVEGSQKFLPAVPGRHVVHESGRWVELNTATFKPRRRVHLILLNDHFLVACEKKRVDASPNPEGARMKPGPSQNQLVAEKCLPIQDVEVVDLASSQEGSRRGSRQQNIGNAINVRVGGESFTFAATGPSDATEKATLLAKFRKSVADMRKLLHADMDEHAVGGASSRKGQNGSKTNLPKTSGEVSSTARGSMLVDVDGQQQNFRWVENQVDELDIAIALQRFEDAVERVDKLRRIAKSNKNNSVVQELVDGKVQERASKLAKSITRRLVERSSYMGATKQYTGWLIKLGFEARASEAFLEARGDALNARTGQCVNTGDLQQYIYQVSFICFTMIRNTVRIYQACFPQNTTSACVRWSKGHVDEFNALLARQVNRLLRGSEERRACMDTVKAHAGMLGEVSIDFRNLIGQGVVDD